MKVFSFKNIRIAVLLTILAVVMIYTKEQRINTTSWYKPIEVSIFPINGDGNPETDRYISQLSNKDFQDIDDFFMRSGEQYQLIAEEPFFTNLGETIQSYPPSPPENRAATLDVMMWSLKLRYWAYKNTPDNKSNKNRIRLYVLYHQANDNQPLEHSLGLQKGLIGVIHAYATNKQNKQNAMVMAHEVLHTVGASDKYDVHNNHPVFPEGYAEPEKSPLHPQRYAEIMAGRIPINSQQSIIPTSLHLTFVGEATAKEINWASKP